MHKTAFMNRIYMIFLHFLPALMIDMIAKCFRQKPRLMKLYKKIHKFSSVISFFCTNEWVSVSRPIILYHIACMFILKFNFSQMFTNSNVQQLWRKLGRRDQDMFDFNMKTMDWEEYSYHYIKGMRLYLFKDDLSTLESAKRKWRRYYFFYHIDILTR